MAIPGVPYDVPVCPPNRLPAEGETIFSKAQIADYKIDANGCWIWQKFLLRGYPVRGSGAGRNGRVHRIYFERANGPVPADHQVHHLCHTTACVNPAHLEALPTMEHHKLHWLDEMGLSLDDVREIRRLGSVDGVRAEDVAERFGIGRRTVFDYWQGSRWAELIGEDDKVTPINRKKCARPGCEAEIPTTKKRGALYCSKQCQVSRYNALRRDAA